MVKNETTKGCQCGCTQRFSDLLRAGRPAKASLLKKVTCPECKKVFWSNNEGICCFDCEKKKRKS